MDSEYSMSDEDDRMLGDNVDESVEWVGRIREKLSPNRKCDVGDNNSKEKPGAGKNQSLMI